jgi:F420-non-reducing hydrogenase small subunit
LAKPKVALYWAATCGGCDVALLDTQTKLVELADAFEFVLWPIAMDFKYKDVERLPEKSIDVCLFNGAIRTDEQEEIAHMLRKRAKVLVAFGACACHGGIPGLGNVSDRNGIFEKVYAGTRSTVNNDGVRPKPEVAVPEGTLTLPAFHDTVRSLDQVVDTDYYVPGCPPPVDLPALGSVLAPEKSVCDECPRERDEIKKIKQFRRLADVTPEPNRCFLDQGIVCCGPATRAGCGARCPSVNMPCRGCFGPPAGVLDQGLKLLSAISSIIDSKDEREVSRIIDGIPDPLGYFYRFGLPRSLFHRTLIRSDGRETRDD